MDGWIDGWMDELRFIDPFNSISVISGRWMKRRLGSEIISLSAGLEPETP